RSIRIDPRTTRATSRSTGLQVLFRNWSSRRRWVALLAAMFVLTASACTTPWLQFGGGPSHQSNDTNETDLTLGDVTGLHQAWQVTLPSRADGAPVVGEAKIAGNWVDLAIVLTAAGDLMAFDLHTGAQVWSISYPAPDGCLATIYDIPCYTTSSPAIIGSFV